jgi:predicted nuclease of predicted toxin-antitoxin system
MNILADENIASSIVQRLQADGHHVERMAEMARGGPDTEVLEIANKQSAVILTEDKDFGELVVRHQMQAVGVVLVRLDGFSPIERAEIVSRVVREHANELPGSFTVIKPRVVRIRPNSRWDKDVH